MNITNNVWCIDMSYGLDNQNDIKYEDKKLQQEDMASLNYQLQSLVWINFFQTEGGHGFFME